MLGDIRSYWGTVAAAAGGLSGAVRKGMMVGGAMGAAYGAFSNDTSMIGGALMGAAAGGGGAWGYGKFMGMRGSAAGRAMAATNTTTVAARNARFARDWKMASARRARNESLANQWQTATGNLSARVSSAQRARNARLASQWKMARGDFETRAYRSRVSSQSGILRRGQYQSYGIV